MIKSIRINLLLFIMLYSTGYAQDLPAIAVIDFNARGIPEYEASIISEKFRGQLVKSGLFNIMERSQMKNILKEQGFQQSGAVCTDASCAVQVGQLLSVEKMIAGSVGKIGRMYILNVKLIDVETGKIVLTSDEQIKGEIEDVFNIAVPKVASKIIHEITLRKIGIGYINVTSQPQGATVTVDSIRSGTTPVTKIETKTGQHKISVYLNHYTDQHRTVIVGAGKTANVHFRLSPTELYLSMKKKETAKKMSGFIKTARLISAGIGVIGLGGATYFHFDSNRKYDKYYSEKDPEKAPALWEEFNTAENNRNIMAGAGIMGVLGLGVTYAF